MKYGDDFCCEPPDDSDIDEYTCGECGMRWYRSSIPDVTLQNGDRVRWRETLDEDHRVALDEPTTVWTTRAPWL